MNNITFAGPLKLLPCIEGILQTVIILRLKHSSQKFCISSKNPYEVSAGIVTNGHRYAHCRTCQDCPNVSFQTRTVYSQRFSSKSLTRNLYELAHYDRIIVLQLINFLTGKQSSNTSNQQSASLFAVTCCYIMPSSCRTNTLHALLSRHRASVRSSCHPYKHQYIQGQYQCSYGSSYLSPAENPHAKIGNTINSANCSAFY